MGLGTYVGGCRTEVLSDEEIRRSRADRLLPEERVLPEDRDAFTPEGFDPTDKRGTVAGIACSPTRCRFIRKRRRPTECA